MTTLIDLTMPLYEGMMKDMPTNPRGPVIWTAHPHEFMQWFMAQYWKNGRPKLFEELPPEAALPGKGHGWTNEQVLLPTHAGSHLDCPTHFDNRDGAWDASQVPIEQCYGDALLLDFHEICHEGYAITCDDLDRAERATGDRVKEGDIVLLRTGWAAKYAYGPEADIDKFFGPYPALRHDTAPWFLDRKVKAVGLDSRSLDVDIESDTHIAFFLRRWIDKPIILIYEWLCYLENIPVPRFTFIGFPLPFVRGSGSPVRAVAVVA